MPCWRCGISVARFCSQKVDGQRELPSELRCLEIGHEQWRGPPVETAPSPMSLVNDTWATQIVIAMVVSPGTQPVATKRHPAVVGARASGCNTRVLGPCNPDAGRRERGVAEGVWVRAKKVREDDRWMMVRMCVCGVQ